MRVALYARVSSEKQAEKETPIEGQLNALRKYAADRGWDIVREFIDEAESARTANRPAFQEMITLAKRRQHHFEAILVWKFSRFARNREDSAVYKSLLRKHGVEVISISEPVDDSAVGRLLEGMIEVIDEFYSANLAQDCLRGQRENARRGFRNGAPAPIGYRHVKSIVGSAEKSRLDVDETYAPIVKRIFTLCLSGYGAKEIVKTLNGEHVPTPTGKRWSVQRVLYVLRNEVYTGTLVWNRDNVRGGKRRKGAVEDVVRVDDAHPALVDRESFEKAQTLLAQRHAAQLPPRSVSSSYLLSGIIYCSQCHRAMSGASAKSGRYHYYGCTGHIKQGKVTCGAKQISQETLEAAVIEQLKINVLTEGNLTELVRVVNDELGRLRMEYEEQLAAIAERREETQRRLDKLYAALESGKLEVDDIAPRLKALRAEILELDDQRRNLEAEIEEEEILMADPAIVRARAVALREMLEKSAIIERRAFIHTFIKRVEVGPTEVTIDYTIPLGSDTVKPHTREVLSLGRNGGASVPYTRTSCHQSEYLR